MVRDLAGAEVEIPILPRNLRAAELADLAGR
jgi:hypothetical protein